eukprot:TRINITY_DN20002_c0_g1_i2.p2 TRINITY_DN20002_c0_g1~~TRINITY_DN20002_c0_g1_i2.p2  ORF type:complete len:243 (-),score=57.82 TRINITY_DN20002_c0_g1_i2:38-682(-)
MLRSLVGSEMCIRDRYQRRVRGVPSIAMPVQGFAEFHHPPSVVATIAVLGMSLHYLLPLRVSRASLQRRTPLAMATMAMGLLVMYLAFTEFGQHGEHPSHVRETQGVVTTGIFSICRSPFYVAFLLGLAGLAVLLDSWWSWLGTLALFGWLHFLVVPAEERFMTASFGSEWQQYMGTVPRWGLFLSLIHISEPTRLLSISYAVFCLKKKNTKVV